MTEIKAQEYINQNFSDKNIKTIGFTAFFNKEKLTGELTIQDYPELEIIGLSNHQLTSLTINNCPNLQQINIRNNQLTKLEITGNENLVELIASQNQLENLNLTNCPQITRLIVCDNPLLTEIKGLNLAKIKDINITNTLINLAEDYEKLQASKEEALEKLKTLKEAAEEKELILTEPIQTPEQAEATILRHLKKTGEKWLSHLKNSDNAVLNTRLNSPERKKFFKDILREIQETQTHKNYQELVKKWSGINDYQELVRKWKNEEDYGLDLDGSLGGLIKLIEAKNYFQQEQQKLLS